MNVLAELKKSPGFVYQIGTQYYFLGKFICKPCTEMDITDTHAMYDMVSDAGEVQGAAYYFHKLRAYSDFALEAPFNALKLKNDFEDFEKSLSDFTLQNLEKQYLRFAKDAGLI